MKLSLIKTVTKLNWQYTVVAIFCSLLLVWPALYNGYPLLYSDSGTYLDSGIHLNPPMDRPLFYGYFIRITSMQASLWPIVIGQGFLSFWIINRLVKQLKFSNHYVSLIGIISLLVIFTGLPWYTAQMMPDFFTSLSIVLIYLLFSDTESPIKYRYIYFFLLFFSIGTHLSNTFIIACVLLIICILNTKKIYFNYGKYRRTIAGAITVIGLVFISHSWINYTYYGKFKISLGSNLFLAAKCLEGHILKPYMLKNPSHLKLPFSNCIDSIPESACGFLWNSKSPLNYPTTNRIKVNEEFGPVLKDMFSYSTYRMLFLKESVRATKIQIQFHKVGSGLIPYGINTPPYWVIRDEFETEYDTYMNSKQQKIGLEQNYHDSISYIVFIGSLLIIMIGVFVPQIRKKYGFLIATLLIGFFANAFVTASIANIYDRLQVRVVWLITFCAIIILGELIQILSKKIVFSKSITF